MSPVSQSATTSEAPVIGTVEAAALLGLSVAYVKRLALAGDLPVLSKLPGASGAWLFDRAAILEVAAARAARS